MKKFLFSILGAFMVSTMASAQYVNVKMDDGTYASYKTSSKTEVDFGKKKGAELTPAGYYSKAEVDSMLTEIKDVLLGDMTVEDAKDYFFEHYSNSALSMFREHQNHLEEICELLIDVRNLRHIEKYMEEHHPGILDNHQRYLEEICSFLIDERYDVNDFEHHVYTHGRGVLDNHQRFLEDLCELLIDYRDPSYIKDYRIRHGTGVLDNHQRVIGDVEKHQTFIEDLCELMSGTQGWFDFPNHYKDYFPYGVLAYINPNVRYAKAQTTSIPANAEAVSLDEALEENKFLKNKIAELEKRLEALEAK